MTMVLPYEMQEMFRQFAGGIYAAHAEIKSMQGMAELVMFRECWSVASPEQKKAFADSYLAAATKKIAETSYNPTIEDAAMRVIGEFVLEEHHDKLKDAMVAKIAAIIARSDDYDQRKIYDGILGIVIGRTAELAKEHVGELDEQILAAIRGKALDQSVEIAASSLVRELRKNAEKATP